MPRNRATGPGSDLAVVPLYRLVEFQLELAMSNVVPLAAQGLDESEDQRTECHHQRDEGSGTLGPVPIAVGGGQHYGDQDQQPRQAQQRQDQKRRQDIYQVPLKREG